MTSQSSIRNLTFAMLLVALPAVSLAGVLVSITVAPPVLPVYAQPICPGDGYMWTPGYWAYGPAGYYWVPGAWVLAPRAGVLWTPGYWGFGGGLYVWHAGYWGPHVGFYGGVNYGFGYGGVGFGGGMWRGGHFSYNTAVTNVNTSVIHNTYVNRTVINNNSGNRTSFNGPGGVRGRPTPGEMTASREPHIAPTSVQASHERAASMNRSQLASTSHGRAGNVAAARPRATPNRAGGAPGQAHANAQGAHRANAPKKQLGNHPGRSEEERR